MRLTYPDFVRPIIVEEEADPGDAGRSSRETVGHIVGSDPAESENRNGTGGFRGGVERVKAEAREFVSGVFARDHLFRDHLFKDRREEDEGVGDGGVGVALGLLLGTEDFADRVAGVADDGVASSGGEARAGLGGGAEGCAGRQMDTVGASLERDGCGAVDEDAGLCVMGADSSDDFCCNCEQVGWGEVLFAYLDVIYAARGPLRGKFDKRSAARILVGAREVRAVGNGIEKHVIPV